MEKPIKNYWQKRLTDVKNALEGNNFEVFLANTAVDAREIVQKEIITRIDVKSVSWGGSMTFLDTGLYEAIRDSPNMEVLDTFDKSITGEKNLELRKRSLFVDLFITGTNAVTETGTLVNLDMIGNRVAGITFGPKYVVILVGRNKIVPELDDAMFRIKNYAAPVNAMRLDKKTPCAETSFCQECNTPERICNSWAITEKSFPKGRIKVVLINEDMGL
ncbi:MAG: lactate utilization protein [Deltaproteobacteria bacterium]|nr:lactate utilization protein [Deltaproteobacteria bacterium]MBW2117527.1 lactate utilization protein [Deltaproteobacteria bacterium]